MPGNKIGRRVNKLKELVLKLYDTGFNVVPVDSGKKPLCSWSPKQRIAKEQLLQLLDKASGIAVVGGAENPWKPVAVLAIIDVDNPNIVDEKPYLKSVIESTVSWYSGVRCLSCGSKHVKKLERGKQFKCGECGLEFALESARRGIGALISIDNDTAEKYLQGTIRSKDVEILINSYALIPPSKHASGVRYKWIKPFNFSVPSIGVRALSESEVKTLLEELGFLRDVEEVKPGKDAKHVIGDARKVEEELRKLSDDEILKVEELLKDVYREGNRQHIWLFLSGWGAKAHINPISIAKILKMLYDKTNDKDPLKTRAGAVVYSYKKAGVDIDRYASEFEELFGVKPYGLEKEIYEDQIKGKTGLQEILEQVLGEERALEIIRALEEVFRVASPYKDSVIEILDYDKQLYAVANLRKLVVVRARRLEDKLIYKERVAVGAPVEVTVYVNPIGGVTKYQVRWEALTRPRPLVIGPATAEDIIGRLRIEGLVLNSRLVSDVVTAIIEGFVRRGKAVIKHEIESPGFYLVENKVIAVNFDFKEPSDEELKEALELLNELAEWYRHIQEKFAVVVRWALVAPFSYVLKQKGRWLKWLYLYGTSKTGKTTLGEIALAIWGLNTGYIKTGASMDTPARLGNILKQSTFPILVNEPGGALSKDELVEMFKNAVESMLARGKYMHGSYIEIPALTAFIFTSNKHLPRDDALLRRLIVLRFTFGEKIPDEKAREFESRVKYRLTLLKSLGSYIASRVVNKPELLNMDWEESATQLLLEAYRDAGMQPPKWIEMKYKADEDIYEDVKDAVRAFLVKRINDEYAKLVGKALVEISDSEYPREEVRKRQELSFRERCRVVLENKLLPWAILKNSTVYFLAPLAEELRPFTGDIGGLKSIAEVMGWDYKVVKIGGRTTRVATSTIDILLELLSGEIEEQNT